MGLLREVFNLANKAESVKESRRDLKEVNSITLEPAHREWSIDTLALVRNEHFWDLDNCVEISPGEPIEIHFGKGKDEDTQIYLNSDNPIVRKEDWILLIDEEYEIIHGRKVGDILDFD